MAILTQNRDLSNRFVFGATMRIACYLTASFYCARTPFLIFPIAAMRGA
jgi:hypothetical protein